MKIEISNYDAQKKFNALYWGQPVGETWVAIGYKDTKVCQAQDGFRLRLKSVNDISDEDAIEIAKMYSLNINKNEYSVYKNDFGKTFVSWGETYLEKLLIDDVLTKSESVDYLRSKGYALPYLGLSVQDLINAGWVKLV